jgi:hypothetical protein
LGVPRGVYCRVLDIGVANSEITQFGAVGGKVLDCRRANCESCNSSTSHRRIIAVAVTDEPANFAACTAKSPNLVESTARLAGFPLAMDKSWIFGGRYSGVSQLILGYSEVVD